MAASLFNGQRFCHNVGFLHMTISRFILLSAVMAFVCLGCKRHVNAPPSGFRLTVHEVATDTNVRAALLAVQTANEGSMLVKEDNGQNSVLLPDPPANGLREGSVALVASRMDPPGEGKIYIQTLIRPQTPNGGYAGGPSTYTLPQTTQLADHFMVTAKSGDYPLGVPIEIARLRGKPVTLTVGIIQSSR